MYCLHLSKINFVISHSVAWHILHLAENIALETAASTSHLAELSRAALLVL